MPSVAGGRKDAPEVWAALAVVLILGVTIAYWPVAGFALGAFSSCLVLLLSLPARFSVAVPIAVLFMVPADQIQGLGESAQGFFALGGAICLVASVLVRGARVGARIEDWDLYALALVLFAAAALHAGAGELRNLLFRATGILGVLWLRAQERWAPRLREQITWGIIAAGLAGSVVAVLDFLGVVRLDQLMPWYEPHELEFTYFLGQRASGLSGHPLRLGTLTMLSCLLAMAMFLGTRSKSRGRAGSVVALGICLVGLVLSGARGAWLGFAVGLVALVFAGRRSSQSLPVGRILAGLGLLAILVWSTGLWRIISERLFGLASHPGSFLQRYQALLAVAELWTRIPILGVGFGGADEITQNVGLRLPNLENEYLRFLLTAGLAGPLAFLALGLRRIRLAHRSLGFPHRAASISALVALFVNVATYNTFSWSVGPLLLYAVAFTCMAPHGDAFTTTKEMKT